MKGLAAWREASVQVVWRAGNATGCVDKQLDMQKSSWAFTGSGVCQRHFGLRVHGDEQGCL